MGGPPREQRRRVGAYLQGAPARSPHATAPARDAALPPQVAGPALSDLSKAVESGGASIKLPEIPSDFSSLKAPDASSFTAPDFSSIKAPDLSGLKMPDLSSLKLPDAPDMSGLSSLKLPDAPDMSGLSNLKLPDAPDLSGLKMPDAPDMSGLTSSLPPNPLAVQPASALAFEG